MYVSGAVGKKEEVIVRASREVDEDGRSERGGVLVGCRVPSAGNVRL